MAENNLDSLSIALPGEATFSYSTPGLNFGAPSYLDIEVMGGGVLDGSYDGYCIDVDRGLFPTIPLYPSTIYSSYEELPAELVGTGNIESPENLDLLNWLINQNFVGQTAANGETFTYGDVQRAIWELIDDEQSGGVGPFSDERVQEIVDTARVEGEGFVPSYGEEIALILAPDRNGDSVVDAQIIIIEVELAQLGDLVFEDSDRDGIQDEGEEGIAGVSVDLLADIDGDGEIAADEIIETTTTAEDGSYSFAVVPGDYRVAFTSPEGFDGISPRQVGNDPAIDSDGLLSDVVTLTPGEFNDTLDAGFFQLEASLGDYVFRDGDADGIQDEGEMGIAEVIVELLDASGNVVDVATSDDSGFYEFVALTPANYSVRIAESNFETGNPLAGFFATIQNAGSDDSLDSDGDRLTFTSGVTPLEPGEDNLTLDFGFFTTGIDLEKSAPETVAPGEAIEYSFTLTNTGDVPLEAVELLDPLISEMPLFEGTLAPGEMKTISASWTPESMVIDFETDALANSLSAGQIIDDEFAAFGITVSSSDSDKPAMIFDSGNPTGSDPDLGTPNQDFGGPGEGSGGRGGTIGQNDTALDNLLIISEDADSSDPDDNARGGMLTFEFETPLEVESVGLVDIDGNEIGGYVRTFDENDTLLSNTMMAALGDNSVQELEIGTAGVSRLEVEFIGSGAMSGLVLNDRQDVLNEATVTAQPVDPDGLFLPALSDSDDALTAIAPEPAASEAVYPQGAMLYNGSAYVLVGGLNVTWEAAQAEAKALGGNLATINDAAEEDWLLDTFGDYSFWIGMTDKFAEGSWGWISGEETTYTNFAAGRPNNLGNQDYAVMNWNGSGRWDDLGTDDFIARNWGSVEAGIAEIPL